MRGGDFRSEGLFSDVSCEARVPFDHPLRPIQKIVDAALGALTGEFEKLYAKDGRPSIAPERNCFARCCCRPSIRCVRSDS
jgi:transposase